MDDNTDLLSIIIYTSILCMFIPVVILSSLLAIFTIVYDKSLHSTQNYIILIIVSMDLFIGVVMMPISIAKRILHHNQMLPTDTCFITIVFTEMIKFDYLYILCLLCSDKCFQLNFPIFYRNHVTKKQNLLVIVLIVFCQVSVFSYRILYSDHSAFKCTHPFTDPIFKSTFNELLTLFGICIAVCIQMSYITKKRRDELYIEVSKSVLLNDVLAVLFIFAYLPTVVHQYAMLYYDIGHNFWLTDITKIMRYITPVSNGFALYYTRPVYKESFKLLLTTNPRNWRTIKRDTQSKKMAEFSRFSQPIRKFTLAAQNLTEPTIVKEDNSVPSLREQNKSEKDLQARSTDTLGK